MSERTSVMTDRNRFILIGTVIGAAVGFVAALVAAGTLEERRSRSVAGITVQSPKTIDVVKFALAALMLLRQFADLLTPEN